MPSISRKGSATCIEQTPQLSFSLDYIDNDLYAHHDRIQISFQLNRVGCTYNNEVVGARPYTHFSLNHSFLAYHENHAYGFTFFYFFICKVIVYRVLLSIYYMKTKKHWSTKYKKSINCKNPRGFSQKQYCKYGKTKRKR